MLTLLLFVWILLIIGGFSLGGWILGLLAIFVPIVLIGLSLSND